MVETRAAGLSGIVGGIGLGHRPEVAGDLLAHPEAVDFVEVVAEACLASERATREAQAISVVWPVALHGVKVSLGSADGISEDHARRIGQLARRLRSPVVSEHISFTRAGSHEIGHLTRLPYTRAAVAAIARNVATLRRYLPDVPLLLENTAATFAWPEDELDEPDFHAAIVAATGCDLLLDVGNLYANAVNRGRDPHVELARHPLDRVAMFHVAGGCWEGGFYFDTHADPIPAPVWALVEDALRRVGPAPILLERDAGFGSFDALRGELDRLRGLSTAEAERARGTIDAPNETRRGRAEAATDGRGRDATTDAERVALAEAQRELARLLVVASSGTDFGRFDAAAITRTREILARKRIDDALPHLPGLRATGQPARDLAAAVLGRHDRAGERASAHDAWWILEAALAEPSLRSAAALDGLVLRARFLAPSSHRPLRPRLGPFVGRMRTPSRTIWALKGPGTGARVHLLHGSPTGVTP